MSGAVHRGLQGDGELELRIDWKAENDKGVVEVHAAPLPIPPGPTEEIPHRLMISFIA